jgi:hypothetical protein
MKQQLSGATVLLWQDSGPSMGQLGALENKAGEKWDGAECEEASQLRRGIWEKRPAAKEEREERLTMVGVLYGYSGRCVQHRARGRC